MSHHSTSQDQWESLPDHSRVWIYQSGREFSPVEEKTMTNELEQFVGKWNAHGSDLQAAFAIFYKSFVVLMVDEQAQAPSGCSIDKSVHLLQRFEKEFNLDLFDRTSVALMANDKIERLPMHDLWAKLKAGTLDIDETLVFDNLVKTKGELLSNWIAPVARTWHKEAFTR